MDYSALTTSDIEWRAAICLCGSSLCRGSFLHYATQDDLQQVSVCVYVCILCVEGVLGTDLFIVYFVIELWSCCIVYLVLSTILFP